MSGREAADAADDARATARRRYSWDKTILRPGGLGTPAPGTRTTLGQ